MTEFVKLKGIGRWSAEIYLLFAWGHPDVWPADDLELQLAVQWLKGRPSPARRSAPSPSLDTAGAPSPPAFFGNSTCTTLNRLPTA
ncbi:MAG TPA: hypothetical protein VF502_16415 [Stellaceae bacterium]